MQADFDNPDSALYLHAFNLVPSFGPIRLMKVGKYFNCFKEAYFAGELRLLEALGDQSAVKNFLELRARVNLEEEAEKLQKEQIKLVTYKDGRYPKLLKEISQPPALLYYKGVLEDPEELCLAAVGTRMISNYGRTAVPLLVEPLIEAGVTMVSGLAYGIDSAVQQLAVKREKRTIAVLGGGLDDRSFYPKDHAWLAMRILDCGGALISEYPLLAPPLKHHFVARNRIISGLSLATIIIECSLKSGSLITAKYALEQNRTVYAVPGPIFSETSKGANNLIKMGARPVTEAADILDDLNLKNLPEKAAARESIDVSEEELALIRLLGHEPVHINELIRLSSLEPASVTSALTFLEMKGKVRNLGGQQFILSR